MWEVSAFSKEKEHISCPLPDQAWQEASPESQGISASNLEKFANFLYSENRKTDGLVIIRNNCLIYERYGRGYNRNMKHVGWSITKSISSALLGILEGEKIVNRYTKVKDLLPYFDKKEHSNLNLLQLIQMRSGIKWIESYSNFITSNAINMLYTEGFEDVARYTASLGMIDKPGKKFQYVSGATNVLMSALNKAVKKSEQENFPWIYLFEKIGMQSVTWERDKSGAFIGATGIFAIPRDYARFGLLYLNNGNWNNQQIIPKSWIELSTRLPNDTPNNRSYGLGWWLNQPIENGSKKEIPWKLGPPNMYAARGYMGQYIIIVPDMNMVVVRTGTEFNQTTKIEEIIPYILELEKP
ncbi:MAG: serine hydrolase [Bdellovibrionota bacterium]